MPAGVEETFSQTKTLLFTRGFTCDVSLKEFRDWLATSTAYRDVEIDDVLGRPLLVAHEILEIAEAKRMGLPITKSVILENPELVYEAHLNAFEAEIMLAKSTSDWDHIRGRLKDVRSWAEDPLLPPKLRPRCRMLHATAKETLKGHSGRQARFKRSRAAKVTP